MIFVFVALTRGRVITSSLPTVTPMVQPRALFPIAEVTPSLLFSRKIYKKNRNPESIKTEIRSKMEQRLPCTGREGGESVVWL